MSLGWSQERQGVVCMMPYKDLLATLTILLLLDISDVQNVGPCSSCFCWASGFQFKSSFGNFTLKAPYGIAIENQI